MYISPVAHTPAQDFRTAVGSLRLAMRMDKSALRVRQRLAEVLLSQARSLFMSKRVAAFGLLCVSTLRRGGCGYLPAARRISVVGDLLEVIGVGSEREPRRDVLVWECSLDKLCRAFGMSAKT